MKIPQQTYQYNNINYELEQILSFYRMNRIDTSLDCQRGYVWTIEQKQQLIDTLMFRERIPEFHVIKEDYESIFHFADGKQRITTILKFLNDELEWERGKADETFHELFGKKNRLKFSELPLNFKNMILGTMIPFACYSNMTPASTTKLFRKLNNGTSLGKFHQGLAANISIQQYFLNDLMRHAAISKIFSPAKIEKGNAEQALIRTLILMDRWDRGENLNCDLTPAYLFNYFPDLERVEKEESDKHIEKLLCYREKIHQMLNRLDSINIDKLSINSDYVFFFTCIYAYKNNYNNKEMKTLYETLNQIKVTTIVGSGSDYGATNMKKIFNYINNKVKHA